MNPSTSIAVLCASIALVAFAPPARSDAAPALAAMTRYAGQVVNPDGSPAAGAMLFLSFENIARQAADDVLIGSVTYCAASDKSGAFHIDVARGDDRAGLLYVSAPAGIAVREARELLGGGASPIALSPRTCVRVRVMDDNGRPVANAGVYPAAFGGVDDHGQTTNYVHGIPQAMSQWIAQTDAGGWASFTGLPQGMKLAFAIYDGYAGYSARHIPFQMTLARSPQTPDQIVRIPRAVSTSEAPYDAFSASWGEGGAANPTMDNDPANHGNGEDAGMLIRRAEAAAAASGKRVMLIFHASWCPDCYNMHRLLRDPKVHGALAPYFVMQGIDVLEQNKNGWENPGAVPVYDKYGGGNHTIPYIAVVDASGAKLADFFDYPYTRQAEFCAMIKAAAPGIQADELYIIKEGISRVASGQ